MPLRAAPCQADELDGLLPSDTLAAVHSLLAELPELPPTVPRLLLRHQLYTVVPDRTAADKELQELTRSNAVLLFRLGPTGDEIVMLTDEYNRFVRAGRVSSDH